MLRRKPNGVVTIHPDSTVRDLLGQLAEHKVGALVVSVGEGAIDGIVSERDIVRRLHAQGASVLDSPVRAIMTTNVRTCTPSETVESLMVLMTENRFRHVPVVEEDLLIGIVSIGDVVKNRIGELQDERDALTNYISS